MVDAGQPSQEEDNQAADAQGGDRVGGDKFTAGDIAGSAVAFGRGAQATVHIVQAAPPPLPPLQALNVTSKEFFTARQDEIAWLLAALQPGRVVILWGPGVLASRPLPSSGPMCSACFPTEASSS